MSLGRDAFKDGFALDKKAKQRAKTEAERDPNYIMKYSDVWDLVVGLSKQKSDGKASAGSAVITVATQNPFLTAAALLLLSPDSEEKRNEAVLIERQGSVLKQLHDLKAVERARIIPEIFSCVLEIAMLGGYYCKNYLFQLLNTITNTGGLVEFLPYIQKAIAAFVTSKESLVIGGQPRTKAQVFAEFMCYFLIVFMSQAKERQDDVMDRLKLWLPQAGAGGASSEDVRYDIYLEILGQLTLQSKYPKLLEFFLNMLQRKDRSYYDLIPDRYKQASGKAEEKKGAIPQGANAADSDRPSVVAKA